MERIINIGQLKAGDKIIHLYNFGNYEILEFVCIHPHSDSYSVMLNHNDDGAPKFYNHTLETTVWYRYTGEKSQWAEIHKILGENLRKESEYHVVRSKQIKQMFDQEAKH